jgi:guanylate kinase
VDRAAGERPLLFVLFGPGGVGKGTLVERLLHLRDNLWLSRSWTTRPRRPGEAEDAYVFVGRDKFLERVRAGGFVEWTEFAANGHLYGTPAVEPPPGHDVLLEIEVDGARQVKAAYPDAVLVMVTAPSNEAQAERLRARGDAPDQVRRRLEVGETEQLVGREMAAHVVVNDDVERASAQLAAIVDQYRQERARRLGKREAGDNGGAIARRAMEPANAADEAPAP